MSYLRVKTALFYGGLAVLTFALAQAAPAADDKPLELKEYRSFVVGGERVTHPDGTVGLSGHLYVEALIPHKGRKNAPPIVMTHSSIAGTIFLERANGEEGWAVLFARAGYPVYVVDPPGTGRAGVDLTLFPEPTVSQSNSGPWVEWKHGPKFGELGFNEDAEVPEIDTTPHQFPMSQMNTDEESVNRWLGHRMVYTRNPGGDVTQAAFIALLEQIGEPVIWSGWSMGGLLGQNLIMQRPDLFKAIAVLEGCTDGRTAGDQWTPDDWQAFVNVLVDHDIPYLHVNPDYARGRRLPSGTRCTTGIAELNAAGGNGLALYLPDVGIFGNGHEYMLQNNADEIAQVYVDWLEANVRPRGKIKTN